MNYWCWNDQVWWIWSTNNCFFWKNKNENEMIMSRLYDKYHTSYWINLRISTTNNFQQSFLLNRKTKPNDFFKFEKILFRHTVSKVDEFCKRLSSPVSIWVLSRSVILCLSFFLLFLVEINANCIRLDKNEYRELTSVLYILGLC